jgi:hypothetical protein
LDRTDITHLISSNVRRLRPSQHWTTLDGYPYFSLCSLVFNHLTHTVHSLSAGVFGHTPHLQPSPYSSLGPGSIITTVSYSGPGPPGAALNSSFNPSTLARRVPALLPLAFSPTYPRILLLNVHNPDIVPRPGDASRVLRVEMMVRLAHGVNTSVEPVEAPAFVHKAQKW